MFQPNYFQRIWLSILLLIVAFCLGCKENNPGKWPADQVAVKVSESLELSELVLNATGNGLEGSGKRSDGETVSVIVKQDETDRKISWEAKGDRGFVESGSYFLTN